MLNLLLVQKLDDLASIPAIARASADGLPEFRSQKVFYKKGNWWRYGSGTAMRVLKSFVDTKQIEQEMRLEDGPDDKPKAVPTGRIRWVG